MPRHMLNPNDNRRSLCGALVSRTAAEPRPEPYLANCRACSTTINAVARSLDQYGRGLRNMPTPLTRDSVKAIRREVEGIRYAAAGTLYGRDANVERLALAVDRVLALLEAEAR